MFNTETESDRVPRDRADVAIDQLDAIRFETFSSSATASNPSKSAVPEQELSFLSFDSRSIYPADSSLVASSAIGTGGTPADTMTGQNLESRLDAHFAAVLTQMTQEGLHSREWFGPWQQNFDERKKCYNQAENMAERLFTRFQSSSDPVLSRLEIYQGTINTGRGSNPVDFYGGNGEHNFLVIKDPVTGQRLYADPWSATDFTDNAANIPGVRSWSRDAFGMADAPVQETPLRIPGKR